MTMLLQYYLEERCVVFEVLFASLQDQVTNAIELVILNYEGKELHNLKAPRL